MKLLNIEISDDDAFIARRKKAIKMAPFAVIASLALLSGYIIYLWIKAPFMISISVVMQRLQENSFPLSTLQTAMIMMPMNIMLIVFLMLVLIIFLYIGLSREKRYIKIIEELKSQNDLK
jgi:hypothetical protein